MDELLSGSGSFATKTMKMEDTLRELICGAVAAEEIQEKADEMGVSLRTLMIAKKNLGVISEKQDDRWF